MRIDVVGRQKRNGSPASPAAWAVEGVIVEVMTCDALHPGCDVNRIVATKTDANGYYSLPELHRGASNFLWLTKAGFRIDVQLAPGCDLCYRSLTIDGDTRLDIELSSEGLD
jgi:hypothetical protein